MVPTKTWLVVAIVFLFTQHSINNIQVLSQFDLSKLFSWLRYCCVPYNYLEISLKDDKSDGFLSMFSVKKSNLFTSHGKYKILTLLSLVLLSSNVSAQWYEATGQAQIRHCDNKSAKSRALQEAVKQTLLFSGANVASVQKISQGVLVDDYTMINSHGSVNSVEIIDETYRDSTVSITIRADIFTEDEKCYSSDFGKKVAITQFPIQHWSDAQIGGLYPLEKEVPRRLMSMLRSASNAVFPVAWLDKKLNINQDFEQQGRVRYQLVDAVANSANTQFVMFGRITDLSFGSKTNDYQFWQDDTYERFFALELMIANALTHEVLYHNEFQTSADWPYSKKKEVNVKGREFWDKEYGEAMEDLLTDVRNDIVAHMSCQEMQSKIVSVQDGEQIQLNIGRAQGVSVGQEYRISYRSDVLDDNNNLLTNFVISPYRVKITRVYENSAIAESLDTDFMSNVQPNDIIELKNWSDDW